MDHTDRRMMDAEPADAAADFNQLEKFMGQLRTANKRHNRAIVASAARTKAADAALSANATPAKAAKTA